ncbi:MAG: hypothetical protein IT520_10720 [Burkholderiales bacterium]|nr:hypothetical protein [Burkholderiales bacterium]
MRRLAQAVATILIAGTTAGAPAQSGTPPLIVQQIACRADADAWRLDATRQAAVLRRSAGKGPRELVFRGEALDVSNVPARTLVWRGSSTHLPAETLVATLREETCRPAGADAGVSQPWRAIVSPRAGDAMSACCTVRTGYDLAKAPVAVFADKPESDWARHYPDVFTSIRRCLSDARFAVAKVVHAAPREGDGAYVQLVATDGRTWTCTAGARLAKPVFTPAAAPGGAPDQPEFHPLREGGPILSCGRVERVPLPGSRNRTEGWLQYDRAGC